jgi:hypothetical protein
VLRSAAFFDWAGAGRGVLVLSAYVVVGLILVVAGSRRRSRTETPTAAEPALVAA